MYKDRRETNDPANTTYRARTTAHQPLNWRGLACFSRCTAPDLFSPQRSTKAVLPCLHDEVSDGLTSTRVCVC